MQAVTWNKLEEQFAEFPFMKATSVSEKEVEESERKLGVQFVSDYKEFVLRYGGAIVVSLPIYGVRQAEPMDDEFWSVCVVTMHYRREGWPLDECLYVISSDHAGNPIGIDSVGKVVSYDHDLGEEILIAESFEKYLMQCLQLDRQP